VTSDEQEDSAGIMSSREYYVIPAQTGIHRFWISIDSRLRENGGRELRKADSRRL